MSGFTIPGLGFAKPNETLPPVPADLLAAAASFDGVDINGDDTAMADASSAPAPAPTAAGPSGSQSNPAPETSTTNPDTMMVDGEATTSSLTGALEAFLGSDQPPQATGASATQPAAADATAAPGAILERPQQEGDDQGQGEHPEWEIDSSPYESSSESSSSDSSDDDEDEKEGYELMSIEETARMLMAAESDDEGEAGKAGNNTQLRTKNELDYEPVPKPDVTITPEMRVTDLGVVDQVVENIIVVKAFTPGEYQVLDTGSVLCTAERAVVGVIAETIGKVLQPMYTVMFSSPDDITELGLKVGSKICYPEDHAKFVFTEPLRSVKGSDASNIHDEEVAEDEMEFSDDEREAEYKKQQKQKRREKSGRGGPSGGGAGSGRGGGPREPHPLRNEVRPDTTTLNYDDEDDGPYKPLQRPASFGQGPPIQQSYIEEPEPGTAAHRFGGKRGGRGGGRGKDRGRGGGRGGRGRGGGGGAGHSQPPRGPRSPEAARHKAPDHTQNQPQQWNGFPGAPAAPSANAHVPAAPAAPAFNFAFQMPQQAPPPPQQSAASGGFVPPPPPGWPGPQAGQQAGQQAHFNPAFFAALLGQMQRSAQQGGQQPQWPPQPPPQQ